MQSTNLCIINFSVLRKLHKKTGEWFAPVQVVLKV